MEGREWMDLIGRGSPVKFVGVDCDFGIWNDQDRGKTEERRGIL
jgi:hypothetical protein